MVLLEQSQHWSTQCSLTLHNAHGSEHNTFCSHLKYDWNAFQEISFMTSDLNDPENHVQDISMTCWKVKDEVKHGHNTKSFCTARNTLALVIILLYNVKYRPLGPAGHCPWVVPVALASSKTNRHVPYTPNTPPIQSRPKYCPHILSSTQISPAHAEIPFYHVHVPNR